MTVGEKDLLVSLSRRAHAPTTDVASRQAERAEAENDTLPSDEVLVADAIAGNEAALQQLIERYQPWIYNVAFRIVCSEEDAQDVTQEVLIKVLTRLKSFEGRASFRTWLYRVVVNHILNMKERPYERLVTTFSAFGDQIADVPDLDPPDESTASAEVVLLVEEAKVGCMTGMLLCLDREQRLILVLGEVFGISDVVGAEVTGLTRANFRQKLARARRDLLSFMNDKCGLVNKENPCRCARKTRGFIARGVVDPQRLVFARKHLQQIDAVAPESSRQLVGMEAEVGRLFRSHPFLEPDDTVSMVRDLIARRDVQSALGLE